MHVMPRSSTKRFQVDALWRGSQLIFISRVIEESQITILRTFFPSSLAMPQGASSMIQIKNEFIKHTVLFPRIELDRLLGPKHYDDIGRPI